MLGSPVTIFNKVIRVGLCERDRVSRLEGSEGILERERRGEMPGWSADLPGVECGCRCGQIRGVGKGEG